MKKQVLSLFTAAALTISAVPFAFASGNIDCDTVVNYYKQNVKISGKIDVKDTDNGIVALTVLKSGVSFDDLAAMNESQKEQAVIFTDMMNVKDTDGNFTFTIGYDDGDLASVSELNASNIKMVANSGDLTKEFKVNLVSDDKYSEQVATVNVAAADTSKTDAEFADMLKNSLEILGFEPAVYASSELNGNVLGAYRAYIAQNPIDKTKPAVSLARFKTFTLISALKDDKVSQIGAYKDYIFENDSLKEDVVSVLKSSEIDEYFTNKLAQSSKANATSDLTAFEKDLKTAYILTCARYASGYGELKDAVNSYGSVIGVTAGASDSVYRNLLGSDYTALTFKTAYDNAVANDDNGGNGGNGGSGGGKTNSSGGGNYTMGAGSSISNTPLKRNFIDIDGVDWASEAILALADKNIVNGKEESLFKPYDEVTREEFVKILLGAMNMGGYSYTNHFNDVNGSDWFAKWVNIAFEQNLCQGVGNGNFGVGMSITRQDMAVLVYNALKQKGYALTSAPELNFEDSAAIADYAKEAVANLVSIGALNGVSDTTFEPSGVATRAQAATVIYRIIDKLQ